MAESVNQHIKPFNTKRNSKGNLEISGCDTVKLAQTYGTPLYVMDEVTLRKIANEYKNAFSSYEKVNLMFASKALMTGAIAQILHSEGFGFDVVSGGEIYTLLNAGIDLKYAAFNGNNKTYDEIENALKNNIGHVSVDNFYEISLLNSIAQKLGKKQKILLRITPGIECHTHEYIQTGHLDSKFGFDLTQTDEAVRKIQNECKNLEITGLHAHIGSQIFETKVYYDEIGVLMKELKRLNDTFNLNLYEINIGGGLGITYIEDDCPPSVDKIAGVILTSIKDNCEKYNIEPPALYIEPGRSIVGTAGVTLYTIGSSKQVPNGRKYIAVDGGMADNPRPSMYGALYSAEIANNKEDMPLQTVTVAGRFCESGDILIKNIELNSPQSGDILCVYNTGAYGYSMSSNYNRVLKPAMVLVNNSQSDIIVKRETYEQLTQNDVLVREKVR
ncbi:MAG: diaminopimelate decarboxylase [Candidatus Gastranaerophilales bacterium]|nr:diaminopimelate decarboxylase [Candidatus Gastranaerophilales bacterium]